MGFTHTTDASLVVDTTEAPWMDVALAEERKGVAEKVPFENTLAELRSRLDAGAPTGFHLLDWKGINQSIVQSVAKAAGPQAKALTRAANPEIDKYFDGVTTDPARDPRGRSWKVDSASQTASGWEVTAWCAAFVNWCLAQVDKPRLGHATAASWLRYGIPLASPVYGCVTIVKPARATRSTTGHVAFFYELAGERLTLLGGNQSNRVQRSRHFKKADVLGYRWPSRLSPANFTGATLA